MSADRLAHSPVRRCFGVGRRLVACTRRPAARDSSLALHAAGRRAGRRAKRAGSKLQRSRAIVVVAARAARAAQTVLGPHTQIEVRGRRKDNKYPHRRSRLARCGVGARLAEGSRRHRQGRPRCRVTRAALASVDSYDFFCARRAEIDVTGVGSAAPFLRVAYTQSVLLDSGRRAGSQRLPNSRRKNRVGFRCVVNGPTFLAEVSELFPTGSDFAWRRRLKN